MTDQLVLDFLNSAKNQLGDDKQVADWIVADLLDVPVADLALHYHKPFAQTEVAYHWLNEFLDGKPYQYISHQAYFFDLNFYVDERVLIPRPETEELVEWVMHTHDEQNLNVLDLGTGSGAIAITLKHHRPSWNITASDISSEAIAVARKNADDNHVDISLIESDLFSNISGKFDLVVSNPPYIAENEVDLMDSSVIKHEPEIALFSPNKGLYFYQKIFEQISNHLSRDGELFMEFGFQQKLELQKIFSDKKIEFKKDLSGRDRMLRLHI